jgi:hypothetical protein
VHGAVLSGWLGQATTLWCCHSPGHSEIDASPERPKNNNQINNLQK